MYRKCLWSTNTAAAVVIARIITVRVLTGEYRSHDTGATNKSVSFKMECLLQSEVKGQEYRTQILL